MFWLWFKYLLYLGKWVFFVYKFVNRRVPDVPYAHNIGIPNHGCILVWDFQSLRLTNIVFEAFLLKTTAPKA